MSEAAKINLEGILRWLGAVANCLVVAGICGAAAFVWNFNTRFTVLNANMGAMKEHSANQDTLTDKKLQQASDKLDTLADNQAKAMEKVGRIETKVDMLEKRIERAP